VIRTPRLLLREWRESDRDAWAAMNADPRVMEHFPSTYDRERSDSAFYRISRGLEERGWGLWALDLEGEFIGFTGLAAPEFMPGSTEIGWRLAAHTWGNGYATEAASAVVDHAFGPLALDELVSFTATSNLPSMRVMERIGMTRDLDGDFDHPAVDPGSPVRRHVLYRLRAPRP
jgi:RimJ/RimL family protein N-acetyltransferase